MDIKTLFKKIKKQRTRDVIKIIYNIVCYVCLRFFLKEKSTEKLLLKKIQLSCKIDTYNIFYYYELLTFLNNFETQEYLNIILNKSYDIMIDIWSNIWRLSWISLLHNKNIQKIHFLCDPNPYVFALSKKFYTKELEKYNKNIMFINNAISDTKSSVPFYMIEWNELNGISSLHEENIGKHKVKKIIVGSIPFKEIIDNINISNKQILIKIDVEWHEDKVLYSIIDFFSKSNLSSIDLLVEIREKNVKSISKITENSWYLKEFKKISYNDYFILLKK